jgi:hypothetical protein
LGSQKKEAGNLELDSTSLTVVQGTFLLVYLLFLHYLNKERTLKTGNRTRGCWDETHDCCDFSIDSQTL